MMPLLCPAHPPSPSPTTAHRSQPINVPLRNGAARDAFGYSSPRRNIIILTFLQAADTVMVEAQPGSFYRQFPGNTLI